MRRIVFLVGASGSGKTAAAEFLESREPWAGETFYFDAIGVSSPEEMAREFGSGEAWQRWATERWVSELAAREAPLQLIEGQTRPSFINAAVARYPSIESTIVLLDCRPAVRKLRLSGTRNQAELASSPIENWAAYLRGQADALGLHIVDTSDLSIEELAREIESLIFERTRAGAGPIPTSEDSR